MRPPALCALCVLLAAGVAAEPTRAVCIQPILNIPPPGSWPGDPVLLQVQAMLVTGDRMQTTEVRRLPFRRRGPRGVSCVPPFGTLCAVCADTLLAGTGHSVQLHIGVVGHALE